MRQLRNLAMAILLSTTGILMSSTPAWAGKAGVVTHLSGVLNVTRLDGTSKIISVKSEVMEGDTLRTEIDTFARIKFNDGGEVVLRPESILKLDNYAYDAAQKGQDNFMASLLKGGLRSVTGLLGKRNPDRFKLNTSAATIGIRGTHFGAVICNNDCANSPHHLYFGDNGCCDYYGSSANFYRRRYDYINSNGRIYLDNSRQYRRGWYSGG